MTIQTPPRSRTRYARVLASVLLSAVAAIWLGGCNDENESPEQPPVEISELSPEEMDARYFAAMARFEEKGEEARAEVRTLMTPLAPLAEGETGHPGAHLWIASDLLRTVNRLPGKLRKETMAGAQSHLEKSIALDPDNLDAHLSLGQLYAQQRNPEKAIEFLSASVDRQPGLKVLLAHTYKSQDNQEMAEKYAAEGSEYWKDVATREPENSVARLRWARAEMLLDHDEEVFAILKEGRKQGDPKPYDQFEFTVRMGQVRDALSADPPQPAEAIATIQLLLEKQPQNPQPILKLSDIGVQFPDQRTEIRTILEEITKQDEPPWAAYYALATLAMEEGDYATALPYAEKNFELAPKSPFVVINYAWCLSKVSPPNHNLALEVVETLPPGFKTNPIAQRTRGRILVRLGRHEEGLEELRKALPSIKAEEQMEAHELMAEAQEALGNFELAKEHHLRSAPGTDPKLLATVPLPDEKPKKKKKKKKGEQYEPGVRKVMLPTNKSAAPPDAVRMPQE